MIKYLRRVLWTLLQSFFTSAKTSYRSFDVRPVLQKNSSPRYVPPFPLRFFFSYKKKLLLQKIFSFSSFAFLLLKNAFLLLKNVFLPLKNVFHLLNNVFLLQMIKDGLAGLCRPFGLVLYRLQSITLEDFFGIDRGWVRSI